MPFLRLAHPGGRSNFLGWPRSALVPEGCREEAQLQVRDAWDASRTDVLRLVLIAGPAWENDSYSCV